MFVRSLAGGMAVALVLAAGAAARGADVDDACAAVKKLADAASYSWTTTVEGGRGNQAPSEFKTEKNGYTMFSFTSFQGDASDVVMKGDRSVAKVADGWKTTAELQKASEDAGGFSPEMFVLIRVGSFATPAAQATSLLEKATNVKKAGDVFTADLAEASAKDLLSFKMPAGMTSTFPEMVIKGAKGTLKLTVKDGMLSRMEVRLTGTRTFNEEDTPVDQTTTAVIKDVGATKITVPEDAKKKLDAAPATAPATRP